MDCIVYIYLVNLDLHAFKSRYKSIFDMYLSKNMQKLSSGRRDSMVVRFTITCAISAYHN
jgi:hypothetical protein